MAHALLREGWVRWTHDRKQLKYIQVYYYFIITVCRSRSSSMEKAASLSAPSPCHIFQHPPTPSQSPVTYSNVYSHHWSISLSLGFRLLNMQAHSFLVLTNRGQEIVLFFLLLLFNYSLKQIILAYSVIICSTRVSHTIHQAEAFRKPQIARDHLSGFFLHCDT